MRGLKNTQFFYYECQGKIDNCAKSLAIKISDKILVNESDFIEINGKLFFQIQQFCITQTYNNFMGNLKINLIV